METSKPAAPASALANAASTETAALADELRELYQVEQLEVTPADSTSVEVIAVPRGKTLVSVKPFIDEWRTEPERRKGTARIQDLDSFVAHVDRFKDSDSAIFANPDPAQPSLTAVLDYHRSGAADTAKPRFGQHRSVYAPPLSDEWTAWRARNGQWLSQGDFAAFLEDRIGDVILPDQLDASMQSLIDLVGGSLVGPSALITLSRGLQVNVETAVREAVTLATGEIAVSYVEQHKDGAGAPIKVGNLFFLAIPVFYAGTFYRVPVRLRYRVQGGRLAWSYSLYRADRAFTDAFNELVAAARDETALPVFVGSPEA